MADYSDEDHEIDIESDEDDGSSLNGGNIFQSEAEKKAHHNALERKRRDHIKESFSRLRDAIPETRKEKTSRAIILKKATEYIRQMSNKNNAVQKEIEKMRRQNYYLNEQVQKAERTRDNGGSNYLVPDSMNFLDESLLGGLDDSYSSNTISNSHISNSKSALRNTLINNHSNNSNDLNTYNDHYLTQDYHEDIVLNRSDSPTSSDQASDEAYDISHQQSNRVSNPVGARRGVRKTRQSKRIKVKHY